MSCRNQLSKGVFSGGWVHIYCVLAINFIPQNCLWGIKLKPVMSCGNQLSKGVFSGGWVHFVVRNDSFIPMDQSMSSYGGVILSHWENHHTIWSFFLHNCSINLGEFSVKILPVYCYLFCTTIHMGNFVANQLHRSKAFAGKIKVGVAGGAAVKISSESLDGNIGFLHFLRTVIQFLNVHSLVKDDRLQMLSNSLFKIHQFLT